MSSSSEVSVRLGLAVALAFALATGDGACDDSGGDAGGSRDGMDDAVDVGSTVTVTAAVPVTAAVSGPEFEECVDRLWTEDFGLVRCAFCLAGCCGAGSLPQRNRQQNNPKLLSSHTITTQAKFGKVVMAKWMHKMATEPQGLEHLRDWILLQINGGQGRRRLFDAQQLGCPDLVPGLRARPFWASAAGREPEAGFVEELERAAGDVLEELAAARRRSQPSFQPYRAPTWANPTRPAADGMGSLGHDKGDWNVLYLHLHNVDFASNCALFPRTEEIIKGIPGWYSHAFFSVLAPGTHIAKHTGPTNKKLRVHLPLVVPPGGASGIRVGGETHIFEEGKCLVFDGTCYCVHCLSFVCPGHFLIP